ncbi:BTB/POZ domain-containing protein 2-like protein [Aphelenchoides avenae]|nr:BTB/POZ domain-containing protein 2-like protein [Aphelenchus avenae]
MLFGDFAGPQVIEITDVEPAAFKTMLRYIYTDEIAVTAENAFPVLEVANKYLVNALRTAAVNCIKRQFQGPQLLDYLPLLGPYSDLQKIWWDSLDTHATAVLKSDAFLELDHDMLRRIISRNTLAVEETIVFERTIQWSKTHLQRETKKITSETVRECLGETFYEIRFTQMSMREFGLGPAKSEYLSDKEKVEIYQCFATEEKPHKFKTEPRANPKERGKPKCRQRTAVLGSSASPSNFMVDIDEAWADAEKTMAFNASRFGSLPNSLKPITLIATLLLMMTLGMTSQQPAGTGFTWIVAVMALIVDVLFIVLLGLEIEELVVPKASLITWPLIECTSSIFFAITYFISIWLSVNGADSLAGNKAAFMLSGILCLLNSALYTFNTFLYARIWALENRRSDHTINTMQFASYGGP